MNITQKIKLPSCWRKLVNIEFPEDLKGITSEKNQTGVADPNPHYDDTRFIEGEFKNAPGVFYRLELCSGQSNYYGGFIIFLREDAVIHESDFMDNFDALEANDKNGNTYYLEVEWVDQWEKVSL